jgi:hypothetical protein
MSSAENALTLIDQGWIQPFHLDETTVKTREMRLHALPWPVATLANLQNTEVKLKVHCPISKMIC